jgi:hypothetical protein
MMAARPPGHTAHQARARPTVDHRTSRAHQETPPEPTAPPIARLSTAQTDPRTIAAEVDTGPSRPPPDPADTAIPGPSGGHTDSRPRLDRFAVDELTALLDAAPVAFTPTGVCVRRRFRRRPFQPNG